MSFDQSGGVTPTSRSHRRSQFVARWLPEFGVLIAVGLLSCSFMLWVTERPPVYQADATVLLLVPRGSSSNPYTYFPNSVIYTAQAVAGHVRQADVRDRLRATGIDEKYVVDVQNDGNQWVPIYSRPNITVSSQGGDADLAEKTVRVVVQEVSDELVRMQDGRGVAVDARITTTLLRAPSVSVLHGRPSRAFAAIGVLGVWGALLGLSAVASASGTGRARHAPSPAFAWTPAGRVASPRQSSDDRPPERTGIADHEEQLLGTT